MTQDPDRVRVVALSDTHGHFPIVDQHDAIANADLVVFVGDFAKFGHHDYDGYEKFLQEFKRLGPAHAMRIIVPGNHDYAISPRRSRVLRREGYTGTVVDRPAPTKHQGYAEVYRAMAKHHNVLFADTVTTFSGRIPVQGGSRLIELAICVVPFMKMPTDHWGWYKTEAQIARLLEGINPMNREVAMLLSHAPPAGTLDYLGDVWNTCIGSQALRDGMIREWAPSVHVFGHVHTQGGRTCATGDSPTTTQCFNVACVDDDYNLVRGPTTFDMVRDGDRWRTESHLVHPLR